MSLKLLAHVGDVVFSILLVCGSNLSQQRVPVGASTERLLSVIWCGFISATARIFHRSDKTWTIELYDCAVLEQKARTVTSVQVWTEHLGASYFTLCPWVRTQHLREKRKEKKKKQPFVRWICLAVSSLQQRSMSRRSGMRSCQGHLPAAGSSTGPATGETGRRDPTAVGRTRRKEQNQADQSPRDCKWHLLFLDTWRQVKISFTHGGNNTDRRSERVAVGEEVSRNNLWVRCSSHKNADEFTFAEFSIQHLVSLFSCQLMRNLSTYVAYCAFLLLAPLAVGSMLSTGKREARETVTRNKAQGFCIPTSCCIWWIILSMCFRSEWALFSLNWGMEDGIWHVQSWYWYDSWLLTSQCSFCSLPIFSLTEWWVGLSHILHWVKSSKSVHKDSSSAQFLWNTYPLALPEVELENGDVAVQHQPPLGASWDQRAQASFEYCCSPAPLTVLAALQSFLW